MTEQQSNLNPQIRSVVIGIKELEPITIYPFSIKDQSDADQTIRDAVTQYLQSTAGKENKELGLANFIVQAIKDNIGRVLAIATGDEDEAIRSGSSPNPMMGKITNTQAVDIADIIFRENYLVPGGKFKGLVEEIKQTFLSKKP